MSDTTPGGRAASLAERMGAWVEDTDGVDSSEAQEATSDIDDGVGPDEDLDLEGDEFDEDADDEAGSTADLDFAPITIVSDGVEYVVEDRDEAIRLLQFGKTFTQRNQLLIEQTRQLEPVRQQLLSQMQQYTQALPQLMGLLQQSAGPEPQPHDFADWGEYLVAKDQWNSNRQAAAEVQMEQQRTQAQVAQMAAFQRAQNQQQQLALLTQKLPEWKDEEVAKTEVAAMQEYGRSMGLNDQELQAMNDHRFVMILRDAARYRSLQSEGSEKVLEAQQKALKPGSRSPQQPKGKRRGKAKKQRARLKKTGSEKDAVPLMVRALGIE